MRSDETYFGYEHGDQTKKVVLRLTGVLSEFKQISKKLNVKENDIIGVKNLGSNIKNTDDNTYKQIFANSWIYNTSSRYQIDDIDNYTLGSTIDRSSLKVGDRVEILQRGSEEVESSQTSIANRLDNLKNQIFFCSWTCCKPFFYRLSPHRFSVSTINSCFFYFASYSNKTNDRKQSHR